MAVPPLLTNQVNDEKMRSLYITSKTQKAAKRFEDLGTGKYQLSHQGDRDVILNSLEAAQQKRNTIEQVVQNLVQNEPRLEGTLHKTMLLLSC